MKKSDTNMKKKNLKKNIKLNQMLLKNNVIIKYYNIFILIVNYYKKKILELKQKARNI